jgi:hypothetical protein
MRLQQLRVDNAGNQSMIIRLVSHDGAFLASYPYDRRRGCCILCSEKDDCPPCFYDERRIYSIYHDADRWYTISLATVQ